MIIVGQKKDGNLGYTMIHRLSCIILEEMESECLGNELECFAAHT